MRPALIFAACLAAAVAAVYFRQVEPTGLPGRPAARSEPAPTPSQKPASAPIAVAVKPAGPTCRAIAPPPIEWRLQRPPDTAAGTLLACGITDDLVAALASADFVLLGETHDNSDHHRAQALLIGLAQPAPRSPAVVMEQITASEAPALAELYRDAENYPPKPAALGEALRFEERGWPEWTSYAPIAEITHRLGGRLIAGDLPRDVYRAIGQQGEAAVLPADRQRLGLDAPWPPALSHALAQELKQDHCDLLPEPALPRMQLVQRVRDATLADAMLAASASGRVVLIAGNGHVRSDRGVPWYLAVRAPEKRVVSILLIEADAPATNPLALVPTSPDGKPAADFAWLTPKADREDPCEGLKRQMRKPRATPGAAN